MKNMIFILISFFIASCSILNKNSIDYNSEKYNINKNNKIKINILEEKYKTVNLLCKNWKKNMFVVIFKRKNNDFYLDKDNFLNLKHNYKFLIKCIEEYLNIEKNNKRLEK